MFVELMAALRQTIDIAVTSAGYEVVHRASVLTPSQRRFWDDNGYLILDRHFSRQRMEAVNQYVDQLWATATTAQRQTVVDVFIGTAKERRVHLCDAPADAKRQPYKLNDLYLESQLVREIVLEPKLAETIGGLMGAVPVACNTLSVEFGTQQPDHTDSLYMTPPDERTMVASWIALEDVHPEAGPLRYWPGSHKIPGFRFSSGRLTAVDSEMVAYRDYMESQCRERGLKPALLEVAAGSVLLWHSQLFHGGSAIRDRRRTRKSLITHYWRARDLPVLHGRMGRGRYYFVRPSQRVR